MRKFLKWVGWILLGLIGLVLLLVGVAYPVSNKKLQQVFSTPGETVPIPTDKVALERGRHLVSSAAHCTGCHGGNLGGQVFLNMPGFGKIAAANLTPGKGGIGEKFSNADWVRAIRHGVGSEGKALLMPSQPFYFFSDYDLGTIIGYIKSLPAVDSDLPKSNIGPLLRLFVMFGMVKFAAEQIPHTAPRPIAPQPGLSVAYGQYVAQTGGCFDCHGPSLAGGRIPGAPPNYPPALNLTPAGNLAAWSEAQFIAAMRTGRTPKGNTMRDPMPWPYIAQLNDELKALWMYLKLLPARAYGSR